MKAYRVENQEEGHGIWRDFDGNVNPVFTKLTHGKCKDMPMEDSDFYRQDGKQWFSATDTPEKLKAWFSALDVAEMQKIGYSVYEFEITSCRVVSDYEICFTRDCIVSQKVIDPVTIYGEEYKQAIDNRIIEEIAKVLYWKGYRKQEWISVDERLPKQWEMVLVFCDDIVSTDFISSTGRWYEHIDHDSVTHWMPLPEPPKMKGGAE